MKYFLTITLTLFAFILVAQSGTTLDEYRYLSKGYAYQLKMGLDPTKKGYDIRQNYTAKNEVNIMGLYQVSDQKLKGLLLEVVDEKRKTHYWVVPNPQSDPKVLQLYERDSQQHSHKKVHAKMLQAKDEYLFMLAANRLQTNQSPLVSADTQTTNSQLTVSPTPRPPTTYDDFPAAKKEEFTAKGGTSLRTQENASALNGSTVTGQLNARLKVRNILVKPYTQNTTLAKGKIMIKFCANPEGVVTYAKFTQRGSTTLDSQLKALALAAVRKMRLAPSSSEEDCGTVSFNF